jgi:hypothetical protein
MMSSHSRLEFRTRLLRAPAALALVLSSSSPSNKLVRWGMQRCSWSYRWSLWYAALPTCKHPIKSHLTYDDNLPLEKLCTLEVRTETVSILSCLEDSKVANKITHYGFTDMDDTHDQWWLVPQSRQIYECGDQGPYNGQLEDWWYHASSASKNQISHLYQKSNQINSCIPWRAYTAAHFVQIWPETVIEYLCATGFKCDGLWVGIELFQMEVVPEHHRRRGCGGTCCQVHYRPWIGC